MADILHRFPIHASAERVFEAITSPKGLDAWWTLESQGQPTVGTSYRFYFDPQYDWHGKVTEAVPHRVIEWRFTDAEPDWTGTMLRIELEEKDGWTWVEFAHNGWADTGEHFRITSYCWAAYLRLLRLYLEEGSIAPYAERLNV